MLEGRKSWVWEIHQLMGLAPLVLSQNMENTPLCPIVLFCDIGNTAKTARANR